MPSVASSAMSFAVAAKGSASGSVTAADSSAPSSTAGARSTCAPECFSVTMLIAEATGTPNATSMPNSAVPSVLAWLANMSIMPAKAAAMASQVRSATGVFRANHASSVANNGDRAFTINVLAVDVSVSAIMKQVNMVAQQRPETSPARPLLRT